MTDISAIGPKQLNCLRCIQSVQVGRTEDLHVAADNVIKSQNRKYPYPHSAHVHMCKYVHVP